MTGQAAFAAFGQVAWLSGLPADAITTLAAAAEQFAVDSGSRFFAHHDVGDGRVALSGLEPGTVLGKFCMLDGERRSADAVAITTVSGWRLRLARFAALQAAVQPEVAALGAALRRQVTARSGALVTGLAEVAGVDAAHALPVGPVTADRLGGAAAQFSGL